MEKRELFIKNDFDKKGLVHLVSSMDIKKPKKITIETVKTNRSLAQNRLMWKWNSEFQQYMSEHYE